mmetsp:Transcript_64108/g.107207  ORF Transcript_64108/g.107207 Transcript_64108/m.107207 type:complete len:87 (-) Transcript_64108:2921-3181(-)
MNLLGRMQNPNRNWNWKQNQVVDNYNGHHDHLNFRPSKCLAQTQKRPPKETLSLEHPSACAALAYHETSLFVFGHTGEKHHLINNL